MIPNIDGSIDYGFNLPDDEATFTLGFKELIFLAFILFFGFCGFTVCVDKIYSEDSVKEIESVTFVTLGSPIIFYLILAFWLNFRQYLRKGYIHMITR